MLVLTRGANQEVDLSIPNDISSEELMALRGATITVKIVDCRRSKARLGFEAPDTIKILRREIADTRNGFFESEDVEMLVHAN